MPNISSHAKRALRALPAAAIVAAIADAAERWRDADFPPRVRATAAIEARLGYSTPVVDLALDRLFGSITAPGLRAAIEHELGSLGALDGFAGAPGRPAAHARGVDEVTIVASDTTIGVAIVPLCFALCAKCAVLVKDRSDALVAAFVATLGEERAELARAVRVEQWTGGDEAVDREALGGADVVVAFGGDDALRAIRERCLPEATFVPFGHRLSAAYLTRNDLAGDLTAPADGIALDALLYDGEGCLSLHLLFVERAAPADMERLIAELERAFTAGAVTFPPGTRDVGRAAAARSVAQTLAFRMATGHGRIVRNPAQRWLLVLDLPRTELPPYGGGVLPVVGVDDLADAGRWVAEQRIPLQAIGIADPALDPHVVAAAFGAVRVTGLGRMQDPPLAGHHGGRPRIAEFVRWIDAEALRP